ncbi:hypothetical protein LC609_13325 [Nostoc sp. XA013]|nr:hypothetical protein [Nostoc sp. XA013]
MAGLATWSFGMVMTKSSSLTQVSNFIAKVNREKPNTVRQRLKEWYQEAEAKREKKRSSLDVSSCFAPLMRWVISLLPRNIQQIALALDATSISDKFLVLSMNIQELFAFKHTHSHARYLLVGILPKRPVVNSH